MLHCEVLQLPCYSGILAVDMAGMACQGLHGVCVCVCVCVCAVGKMAKDIGMSIRKSIVVSFLHVHVPCLLAFLAFHPYMYFHFYQPGACFARGRKPWIVVDAQLQLVHVATYRP